MIKKILFGMIIISLIILPLLTACQGNSASSSQDVYTLKFSSPFMETWSPGKFASYFLDYVEQESNGRVVFERYFGGQLAGMPEHLALAQEDIVDVMCFIHSLPPSDMVLHNIVVDSVLGTPEEALDFAYKVEFEIPETSAILEQEWADNNLKLLTYSAGTETYQVSKFPFTCLEDLKGKKCGNIVMGFAVVWQNLGVTNVDVDINDMYEALSRGLVDFTQGDMGLIIDSKLYEVTDYAMATGNTPYSAPLAVNLKTWESLPPDIQEIFLEAAEAAKEYSLEISAEQTDIVMKAFEDNGITVGSLSEADKELMYTILLSVKENDTMAFAENMGKADEGAILWQYSKELLGLD